MYILWVLGLGLVIGFLLGIYLFSIDLNRISVISWVLSCFQIFWVRDIVLGAYISGIGLGMVLGLSFELGREWKV